MSTQKVIPVDIGDMYREYFLDYASYVILERAVPAIEDGLKPVQRRILYAMYEMHDGRYHKVANIIGQTMQYHPHGDAAIRDALVHLGQKDLIIDTQGNWGDVRTGDPAAAPRYIEARLHPFILHTAFNPKTTQWQLSYDGRKKEPITLPMKFPLLLVLGAEGIAVGLSTRILPHNFIEIIDAAIQYLKGNDFTLYPDFPTGGMLDISEYNDGMRGGKVRIRAKIEKRDKNTLAITQLPYGITTSSLIDSIIKATDKGKIKIKKVVDNTAENVEILIHLAPKVSPDLTIDALYAFTLCEVSVSINACVIVEQKPRFLSVSDILRFTVDQTRELLRRELEIRLDELRQNWLNASLEKIFIENRIYRKIENCETWEAVMQTIYREMRKYVLEPPHHDDVSDTRLRLDRPLQDEDIIRLTEIKIKRISKYNTFKAEEHIRKLEQDIEEVERHLQHLTEYTIRYYEELRTKYGKGRERKTLITTFDKIQARQVVATNTRLYANMREGFVGTGLKKETFICECSDLDDIIAFRKDGKYTVKRIGEKVFMGKNLLHIGVWKKHDRRTTYNAIYVDGQTGIAYAKRFHVDAITRDKEYDLTMGSKGSRVLYFSANPNGEAERVSILLSPGCKARKKQFEFDDVRRAKSNSNLTLPNSTSRGATLRETSSPNTPYERSNSSKRANPPLALLPCGGTATPDASTPKSKASISANAVYREGTYELKEPQLPLRFDPEDTILLTAFNPDKVLTAVYYDGAKDRTFIKRFRIETKSLDQKFRCIPEGKEVSLLAVAVEPVSQLAFRITGRKGQSKEVIIRPAEYVPIKGWKSLGKKLTDGKALDLRFIQSNAGEDQEVPPASEASPSGGGSAIELPFDRDIFQPGDSFEIDLNGGDAPED